MHKERSNCSWIGVMVYIIFIFARMGEFELVLANAGHLKNVSGRKTDVNDDV